MGKRSRRRQRDHDTPTGAAGAARDDVHITVAAVEGMHLLDLRHETELVKAALLYADHVTLASPKALLFASAASLGVGGPEQRRDAMVEMISGLDNTKDIVDVYRDLQRRRQLSPRERLALRGLEYQLERTSDEMVEQIDKMLDEAGVGELGKAVEAGVVDLHPLGAADNSGDLSEAVEHLADLLAESVASTARTFPLFDNGAGSLLQQMLDEGKVSDARGRRPTEAGIAGQLIAGLEAFPHAEMDVVLDVRQRLQDPLTRFRGALAEASTQFESEAWDDEFPREVEDLKRRIVAPALDDLRQTLDELGARPTLLRAASSPAGSTAIGLLALTAATALGFDDLPAILYGASLPAGGAAAAQTIAREGLERDQVRGLARENSFYFLYAADRQL